MRDVVGWPIIRTRSVRPSGRPIIGSSPLTVATLPPAVRRIRLSAPLRHPRFLLLMTGMTVSVLGDGVFLIALTWQVYLLSNTPSALSFVGIAISGPQVLFLLLGGAVSDRMDRP